MIYTIFTNAIESILFISSIFISSTLTASLITKLLNKPFINPKFTKEKIASNMKSIIKNVCNVVTTTTLPIVTTIHILCLDKTSHTILYTTSNIVCYAFFIELAYYIYHRIQHNVLFLKKIHHKHHEHINVFPFDTFYIDYYDAIGLSVCLLYPCAILSVNRIELFSIIYFYATGAYLEHSNILSRQHQIHHERFTCNYCFIFPIFDIICQTHVT